MTIATTNDRDRMQSIRERVRKAREQRSAAQRALETATKAGDADAQAAANAALATARGQVEIAVELESQLLTRMAGLAPAQYSESFLEDPQALASLERLAHSTMPIGSMDLGPLVSASDLTRMIQTGQWGSGVRQNWAAGPPTADPTFDTNTRLAPFYGVVPQIRRRLRLLDLITTVALDQGTAFYYAATSGALDNAAETTELSLKPQGDMVIADKLMTTSTIAVWNKVARQALADIPTLQQSMGDRLTYQVLRRLESQILAGTGAAGTLTGILGTAGIGTVTFSAGEPLSDLVVDGKTTVLSADAEPNAVVANPHDVATMLKLKTSGSGERLDSQGAFSDLPDTMWGLPLIVSTVIPQGQALVGDWAQGATLFVRDGVSIRVSDSDQDDFLRNRATLLAEMRAGVAVFQPAAFALVHLA
jgi:hypothetical protein